MTELINTLLKTAKAAYQHAYAPYSHYRVGASLVTPSGKIFSGTNIENASYGLTLCAEGSAIAHMIAHGERHIQAILVTADSTECCTPCGACRQRIAEFADNATLVHLCDKDRCIQTLSLNELLPYSFNKDALLHRKTV